MTILNLKRNMKNLKSIILEIVSILNLSSKVEPKFSELALILYKNNLIHEIYYNKIKSLDSIDMRKLEDSKSLKNKINDIKLYLEMQFYHYI